MTEEPEDEPLIIFGGQAIPLKAGGHFQATFRCPACRRGLTIKIDRGDLDVEIGTYHSQPHCGWYRRTEPDAIVEKLGKILRTP